MTKTFLTILALASYATLMGCGTTGPLYIPEQRYPQEEVQDTTQNAPDVTPTNQTTNK